jgi:hypothetical protein
MYVCMYVCFSVTFSVTLIACISIRSIEATQSWLLHVIICRNGLRPWQFLLPMPNAQEMTKFIKTCTHPLSPPDSRDPFTSNRGGTLTVVLNHPSQGLSFETSQWKSSVSNIAFQAPIC